MADDDNTKVQLGEIKGILTGIRELMQAQTDGTNRRIDDLRTAITARLDTQQGEISKIRETVETVAGRVSAHDEAIGSMKATAIRSGGISGGGAGGLIALGIEIAKAFLKH